MHEMLQRVRSLVRELTEQTALTLAAGSTFLPWRSRTCRMARASSPGFRTLIPATTKNLLPVPAAPLSSTKIVLLEQS